MKDRSKPLYQPWSEEAFWGDNNVRRMTQLQRWMYRTLLQAAFFGDLRPNLPDDDDELWLMADCLDKDQWLQNSAQIRKMFTSKILDDGITKVLFRNRLEADWDRLVEKRQQLAENGRKGGEAKALANAKQMPSNGVANSGQVSKEVSKKEREEKEEEKTLLAENLLKNKVLANWPGSIPDKLDATARVDLKSLTLELGVDALGAKMDAWAAGLAFPPKRPLAAFLKAVRGLPDVDPETTTISGPVVTKQLVQETLDLIAAASGGSTIIGPSHSPKIAAALASYGQSVVLSAFKDFWSNYEGKKEWSEVDFSGKVVTYCNLTLGRRKQAEQLELTMAAARKELETMPLLAAQNEGEENAEIEI